MKLSICGVNANPVLIMRAIFLNGNNCYVFVETAPGEFRKRAVKVGMESSGRSVILEGLSEGEQVVSEGVLLLQALLAGESG